MYDYALCVNCINTRLGAVYIMYIFRQCILTASRALYEDLVPYYVYHKTTQGVRPRPRSTKVTGNF